MNERNFRRISLIGICEERIWRLSRNERIYVYIIIIVYKAFYFI